MLFIVVVVVVLHWNKEDWSGLSCMHVEDCWRVLVALVFGCRFIVAVMACPGIVNIIIYRPAVV